MVWTATDLHILTGPESSDRPQLWAVRTAAHDGTPNGRTVKNLNGAWVWLTDDAFVVWAQGISKVYEPIKASFALIVWTNISRACAWVTQEGQYVCQVPRTGGGTIWFTFDPASGWLTDTGADVRATGVSDLSGRTYTLVGDTTGAVYKAGGADDAGTPVAWSFELGPTVLGNTFEKKQLLAVELALSLGAGANASAAVRRSSGVCAADIWTRMRALPRGTTG
jgi:hypothetical protein